MNKIINIKWPVFLKSKSKAFTIVELLVVIVVIGILSTIVIVSYVGISKRAIGASVLSDLSNSNTQLEMYKAENGSYPTATNTSTGCPTAPVASSTYCLKKSSSQLSYDYTSDGLSFNIDAIQGTGGELYNVTNTTTPVKIADGWKSIDLGGNHSCGISTKNLAYCWGENSSGQLGNNSDIQQKSPVAVSRSGVLAGLTIKTIDTSLEHTCAIASDNNAYCWGDNSVGQLGDNNSDVIQKVPVAVNRSGALAGLTIKSLLVSFVHYTCVIASDNNTYCWGSNTHGQLGDNSNTDRPVPVAVYRSGVLAGLTIKTIILSAVGSSCAIASDNNTYCWGYNQFSQLGDNSNTDRWIPVAVNRSGALAGLTIKSLVLNDSHSCAVASDNNAYCWGANFSGQLGDNSNTDRAVPVAVNRNGALAGLTIKSLGLSTSEDFSCAVASDNNAYCWGGNYAGQLGNNSNTESWVPVAVYRSGALAGLTIKNLSLSSNTSCVIASDNNAYCWGGNFFGQIGDNSTTSRSAPVAVNRSGALAGLTIKNLNVFGASVCVVASNSNSYCWGYNSGGHLGDNSTTDRSVPTSIVNPW